MGEKVNRNQLASLCGVSRATVDSWVEEGLPWHLQEPDTSRRKGKEGEPLIDMDEMFVWWQQQQVARLKAKLS